MGVQAPRKLPALAVRATDVERRHFEKEEVRRMAKKNAVYKLSIEGELTIYTAADTKGKLVAAFESKQPVEIDLSQVDEIDSAGLQLLILAKREAARNERPLTLVNHSQAVVECLDMCNLGGEFGDQVILPAATE
jgi:anti-anti-sigma factor